MVNLCLAFLLSFTMMCNGAKNEGVASYYHDSLHGNLTANGEIYNKDKISVAHKHMEFGTILWVRNPENGKSIVVRVNDRGPFIEGRDLDFSRRAAEELGMIRQGVIKVEYVILGISNND